MQRVAAITRSSSLITGISHALRETYRDNFTLGVACVAALAPAAVTILTVTDFGDLSVVDFVLYKAILGVALGALVTPAIALRAMAEDPNGQPAPARATPHAL